MWENAMSEEPNRKPSNSIRDRLERIATATRAQTTTTMPTESLSGWTDFTQFQDSPGWHDFAQTPGWGDWINTY